MTEPSTGEIIPSTPECDDVVDYEVPIAVATERVRHSVFLNRTAWHEHGGFRVQFRGQAGYVEFVAAGAVRRPVIRESSLLEHIRPRCLFSEGAGAVRVRLEFAAIQGGGVTRSASPSGWADARLSEARHVVAIAGLCAVTLWVP